VALWDSLIQLGRRFPVLSAVRLRNAKSRPSRDLARLNFEIGDTIEPFFYGDYWIQEEWDCDDCREQMPEEKRWHKAFIHCINGLIVEVTPEKPPQGKSPDWDLIHKLSRDRQRYRQTLRIIRNSVLSFRERTETGEKKRHPLPDIGPKTTDELLNQIIDDVERAERGEPPGLF